MIKNLYLYDLDIKYIKLFNKIYKDEKKNYVNYLTRIFNKQSNFKHHFIFPIPFLFAPLHSRLE